VAAGNNEHPHASVDEVATHIGMILKQQEARTTLSWALVSRDEGTAVGTMHVHGIAWTNRRAYLGFALASRLWRRGLTTEALRCVIDFSSAKLRFRKLCAQNTTSNEPCHALLLSLGFEQEGLLRQYAFWDDRAHDLRQYGLIAPAPATSVAER
jgi:ribosomal-protein-alanine N-acetyltransferase